MMPMRSRVLLASTKWLTTGCRAAHSKATLPRKDDAADTPAQQQQPTLTGSAKLFADAAREEAAEAKAMANRQHLVQTQGPIWTGDESQADSVLRMLVDAHPPHRTGEGIKDNAAEERIAKWMKNIDMQPRHPVVNNDPEHIDLYSPEGSPHRTSVPPHLHRPWHATYTGDKQDQSHAPSIKYGSFLYKPASADDLANDLELRLPNNPDSKTLARVRDARRSHRVQGRLGRAREGAIDYRLGVQDGDMTDVGSENEQFAGNRQLRGSSVLGGAKGRGSGMRAWANLVEERIQSAKDAGFFADVKGRGAALVDDPESKNPHIALGELQMNRIIKRQGALPPWIEMQNSLDSSLNAFRSLLLETYTKHVVRSVLSSHGIHPMPPSHAVPGRDEAFEAKERKFHEENIKQINNMVYKMNMQAPPPARRGLYSLEKELDRVRGDVLRENVWAGIKRRAQDIKDLEARGPPQRRSSSLEALENGASGRFVERLNRSLGGIGNPPSGGHMAMNGGTVSSNGDGHHDAGGGRGLLIFAGLGMALLLYFKRPTLNDSPHPMGEHLIPVQERTAADDYPVGSANEPRFGPVYFFKNYILEPFLTFLRFIHLAILFGPVIITAPMLMVGSPPKRKRGKPVEEPEDNWGAVWWYGFLVKQMERAGPSFIKLGQWAASRADLFPAALCTKMSKLHSNNTPHSFRHTKRVIEKAFGLTFDEIFEEFDETPIGCGAIAQVYTAKLRPEILTGGDKDTTLEDVATPSNPLDSDLRIASTVAIKVLHPRVRKTVRRDIAIMSIFANILNALPGMEWLSLPEEVEAFGGMMNQQLDLRVEGSNLDHFIENFRKRSKIVTFPRPIRLGPNRTVAAAKDVLIEEYEDALPLKYFLANGGGPYDEKIANIGLDAFLEMLLLDNWTHGDLHPGNIMVRFVKPTTNHIIGPLIDRLQGVHAPPPSPIPMESISETNLVHELKTLAHTPDLWLERLEQLSAAGFVPQLIFIDAGLVTSLNEVNRRNFLDLFQAVAEFDGYKAGKLMVERCRHPDLAIDEETFALKMQHLVLSVKSKTFSLAKIKISDILTDVLTAVRQHHVKLEGDFVNTVISILLLEGIGRQLDPDMDLFKSALPIMRQLGRQMGTREAISATPRGNVWAMAKLWIWAEARNVAGEISEIDKWTKYDWMSPNI